MTHIVIHTRAVCKFWLSPSLRQVINGCVIAHLGDLVVQCLTFGVARLGVRDVYRVGSG